ncbi:hypothetical protein TNCV_161991 [Trichonephila clavipes]|nr:hypothetical protein TNCV_161991 [Trichonephila clavipes]
MVSLGDKVFILQFSRFRWRCGTAGKTTASITDELRRLLWRCGRKTNSQSIIVLSRMLDSTGITDEPQPSWP